MGMFAYTCLHITGQIDDTDHYLSKKKVLSTWVAKRAQKKKKKEKKKRIPFSPIFGESGKFT
jgi:hypothetical protein